MSLRTHVGLRPSRFDDTTPALASTALVSSGCYRVVSQSGGAVVVDTALGQGTTMRSRFGLIAHAETRGG
jgi:hypothetical protein